MPESQDGHENIERMLGRVLEATDRAEADRTAFRSETSASLGLIQHQLNGLAGLPAVFAAHETQDAQRHSDNIGRLDKIEGRLGTLEIARAETQGVRKGVGIGFSIATATGAGSIGAALFALAKKMGLV